MAGKRLHPRSDEERQRIGRELAAQRLANDLTLAAVSAIIGKSIGYLLHLEHGRRRPTPEMLQALAAVYGVSPEDITSKAEAAA